MAVLIIYISAFMLLLVASKIDGPIATGLFLGVVFGLLIIMPLRRLFRTRSERRNDTGADHD